MLMLKLDDAVDVAVVALTAGGDDLGADSIELPPQFIDLVGAEVGVFADVGDRHTPQ